METNTVKKKLLPRYDLQLVMNNLLTETEEWAKNSEFEKDENTIALKVREENIVYKPLIGQIDKWRFGFFKHGTSGADIVYVTVFNMKQNVGLLTSLHDRFKYSKSPYVLFYKSDTSSSKNLLINLNAGAMRFSKSRVNYELFNSLLDATILKPNCELVKWSSGLNDFKIETQYEKIHMKSHVTVGENGFSIIFPSFPTHDKHQIFDAFARLDWSYNSYPKLELSRRRIPYIDIFKKELTIDLEHDDESLDTLYVKGF